MARGVEELNKEVDAVRQARGRAMVHFGRCHEYAGELEKLAECFESLGPDDDFAPVIAALSAEAALADRAFNSFWTGERVCKRQQQVAIRKSSFGFMPLWVTPGPRTSGPISSTKPVHSGSHPLRVPTSVFEEPVGVHGTDNWTRLSRFIGWQSS